MTLLSGLVYDPERPHRFYEGSLLIEEGRILEVSEGRGQGEVQGIIIPSFVDAHTHLADGFVCDTLPLDLDEAVSPPDGLKHLRLDAASEDDLLESFRAGLAGLCLEGVGTVCDFREGGLGGLELARRAEEDLPAELLLLARPTKEKEELLSIGDGIGLPSIVGQEEEAGELARECKKRRKLFSFHHAERAHEPLGPVLDMTPDFIVHASHCTRDELQELADAKIGVVVCPAMNALFGSIPPVKEMLDAGMAVALGTDNAMARPPSMLEAMGIAYMLARLDNAPLEPTEVLDMAIVGGRKVLRRAEPNGFIRGQPSSLAVFARPPGCNPENAANLMINHARARDVLFLQWGEWIWKASKEY